MIKKLLFIGLGVASSIMAIMPACARHRSFMNSFGGYGGFPFGGYGFGGMPFGGCGFGGIPFALSGAMHTIKVTETFTTFAGGFSPFNW